MRTSFGLSILALFAAAGSAAADVPPPDPKPGMKRVRVVGTVEVAGELPGYALYRVWWDYGPDGPPRRGPVRRPDDKAEPPKQRATRITFTPGVAWAHEWTLYAVPAAVPAKFPTETALAEALSTNKVPGAHRLQVEYPGDEIPVGDPRTERKVRYVIERVDPEKGVVATRTVDDPEPIPGQSTGPGEAGPGGQRWAAWVAGGAAAAALILAGFWLLGRNRRPV